MNNDRFRFRVWNDESKRYESFPWHIRAHNSQLEVEGEHLSLEQCTGHKDVNGKLIFEEDIVEVLYLLPSPQLTHNGVVRWDGFKFILEDRCGMRLDLRNACNWHQVGIKVIGNIHENPELMED